MMSIKSFHQLDEIETNFIFICEQLINQYPFKWTNVIELIFNYQYIFIYDSSMFIELISLADDELIRLFEIFKIFFNQRIIEKIIYKHQYMCIAFHSEFITSFFKCKNKWLTVPLYVALIKRKYNVYYDLEINDSIYDLGIIINHKLITVSNQILPQKYLFHLPLVVSLSTNNKEYLQFSYNLEKYLNNLFSKI